MSQSDKSPLPVLPEAVQKQIWSVAMEGKCDKMIEYLTEYGSELVHCVDARGQTALLVACMCGKVEVCELLLRNGADFYRKSLSGVTPFTAITHPSKREHLRIYAYNVSPEGIAAMNAERLRLELESEKKERAAMACEELEMQSYLAEVAAIAKIRRELKEKLVRQFVNVCCCKGLWRAFSTIVALHEMSLCDIESRRVENAIEAARLARLEAFRQKEAEAALIRAREIEHRIRRIEAEKERERLRLLKEEEERKALIAAEAARAREVARQMEIKAAEERERLLKWSQQQDHFRELHGVRAIKDRPRLVRIYRRMRLAVSLKQG